MVLDANNFFYALHNGLNHLMVNAGGRTIWQGLKNRQAICS